jgi:hypothetical protein
MIVPPSKPRRAKEIPSDDKHRRDYWPDNEPVDTENRKATQRRDEHEVVGHSGILADEKRAQEIVDSADDEHTVGD